MVDVTVKIYARNTGPQHDLIVGASIFDSAWNFVYDLPWFIYFNAPANMTSDMTPETGVTGIPLSAGTYYVRARAWENYNLTGATLLNQGDGWAFYTGGGLFGNTLGDEVYLDQMDKSFNVAIGQISADITDLQITI